MNRPKKMSRRKFIQICTEEGLEKHIAQDMYIHLKTTRKVLLVNTPSNVEWIRSSAHKAALQKKVKT